MFVSQALSFLILPPTEGLAFCRSLSPIQVTNHAATTTLMTPGTTAATNPMASSELKLSTRAIAVPARMTNAVATAAPKSGAALSRRLLPMGLATRRRARSSARRIRFLSSGSRRLLMARWAQLRPPALPKCLPRWRARRAFGIADVSRNVGANRTCSFRRFVGRTDLPRIARMSSALLGRRAGAAGSVPTRMRRLPPGSDHAARVCARYSRRAS